MKKLWVLLLCSSFSLGVAAQVSRGTLAVAGSQPAIVSLASSSVSQSLGSGAIRVNVQPTDNGSQTVTLLVRGNAAYALTASVTSITGVDPNSANVTVTPLNTSPTGNRAIAGTSANLATATLAVAGNAATILSGSRVSRGGNDLSSDNALAIQVRIDLPAGATEATLTFRTAVQ